MSANYDEVGGYQFGGPVGPGALPFTTGKYIYVHHTGSATSVGLDARVPVVTTIDAANGKCRADKGDIIVVLPGHVETVTAAGGVTFDTDGVTVYFMSSGDSRATINFTTAVTASVVISGNNVTLLYPRFTAGIDALTGPISITGTDCQILKGEWHDATDMNTTDALVATTAADRLKIYGWKFYKSNEGGTQKASHIKVGAAGDVELHDIDINGDFSDGCVYNNTAWGRARVKDCILTNLNAGPSLALKLSAASTGQVVNLSARVLSGTTFVTGTNQMTWRDSYGVNTVGEHQSFPIGDVSDYSLDPAIGSNTADNAFDSTNVTSNADGSLIERAEYIQASIGAGLGAAVAAIQTDLGNPSIRTNLQSIEAMLGNPDTAGATLYAAVGGAAGLPTYPAGAAAANDVSVAEAVRYAQEGIRQDGGTAMAATKSVADALGTNGTTVADSAVSVLGAIGPNNANNAFDSSLVAANVDGSVMERLEDLVVKVTAVDDLIDTEVAAIQTDIGDPSARANFSSLETMIGVPDAVNSNLDDMLRTGFDSTAVAANIDGSVMERLEDLVVKVTAVDDLVDTEVAAIQTDIGDPSARTNLQSLQAMLGNPDTAGETLYAANGTEFVVKKTLTSSAVVQAGVDITGLSSGGDLLIKDIYMNTDATGLATGTNFKIETNNVNGVALIYQETVANLGANATESLANGSVTAVSGTVLESGKKLLCRSTVADCTGAGTITICVVFQRVAGGATVAAA